MKQPNVNDSYTPPGFPLPADLQQQLGDWSDATRPPLDNVRRLAARLQQLAPGQFPDGAYLNLYRMLHAALIHVGHAYLRALDCRVTAEKIVCPQQNISIPLADHLLAAVHAAYPPPAAAAPAERQLLELLLLHADTGNRALNGCRKLLGLDDLPASAAVADLVAHLDRQLPVARTSGPLSTSLVQLLRAPARAEESLTAQLQFVLDHWHDLLPEELATEVLTARGLHNSEQLERHGGQSGPTPLPRFGKTEVTARVGSTAATGQRPGPTGSYSSDSVWMPDAVLIAKSALVWLDQLSKQTGSSIRQLDQIPTATLVELRERGFNALWLIGIWERSSASAHIKQLTGNPEAAASAYALYDYTVASELGGDAALERFAARCGDIGLRLCCDIVPNHTGLYSRWMVDHPDWFIQRDDLPYPGYQFNGPDLSPDARIALQIEDGYWNRSDAAVVFRHTDRRDGRVRFIYHGNDGTHTPWNDTAQLDFLRADVREAVIVQILHLAKRFKLIRFDAAMTLARKHFRRLWYPPPGGGAGIPSRAESPLAEAEFERLFPREFWRELVDRVQKEAPDTLLIAEAFWLMEDYFVRVLGMHRVYNSAFMNMLRQEENAHYRRLLKEVLANSPPTLGRFVNFLNNPDEAPAADQFGKGEKYFGATVLLSTMPGLPMFGHGQVEGLTEKYGMEFRRAYRDEEADGGFVDYHARQIFPLLRLRRLFSRSDQFQLYDFCHDGQANENVFAYSNRDGDQAALVVFNNSPHPTSGRIHHAAPRPEGVTHLAAALGLAPDSDTLYRCHDHAGDCDYLLHSRQLHDHGLTLELGPYQYRVLWQFQRVDSSDRRWSKLATHLGGKPVASLDAALADHDNNLAAGPPLV
jgi:glycosidase